VSERDRMRESDEESSLLLKERERKRILGSDTRLGSFLPPAVT